MMRIKSARKIFLKDVQICIWLGKKNTHDVRYYTVFPAKFRHENILQKQLAVRKKLIIQFIAKGFTNQYNAAIKQNFHFV